MRIAVSFLLLFVLYPVDAGGLDSAVVARVGRFVITGRDLVESYTFGPAFVKRSKNPLRRHLEYMIYESLLAAHAEQLNYDKTAFVRERVDAIEEDLIVDQLYHDEILANVKISREDIEGGKWKAKRKLRLRWIFMEDSNRRNEVESLLAAGSPFDSLYQSQFESAQTSPRSLETTQLEFERDNPELASKIAELGNQEISQAIEGPDGYYILRIDEIWQNPLTTETDEVALTDRATKITKLIKANALARQYVRGLMKQANPIIKAEGFNILQAYLAEQGLSRETRLKWDVPTTVMTEAGPIPLRQSQEFVWKPLVVFANQSLTVKEYLRWFDIRQFQLKTSSPGLFTGSVKAAIWKMVQDRLLSQEAHRRGLSSRDTVGRERVKWKTKLLYLAAKVELAKAIVISDSAIKVRYAAMNRQYVGPSGTILEFDQARPYVWADLYDEEKTATLLRTVNRLKSTIPVDVREDVVQEISRTIGEEGSPINVIFYKPGGTFPRVAFPTIDEEWARFEE